MLRLILPIALGVALSSGLRVGAGGGRLRAPDPRLDAGGFGVEDRAAPRHAAACLDGTIRTPRAYADFVLRFEYRLAAAGADAELLLRARGAPDGPLDYGYRVALDGETSGRRPRGRLRADSTQMRAGMYTGPRTPSANGRWVACEVRAERETLSVSLDGMVVSVADRADAFSGFVAFEARARAGSSCAACGSRARTPWWTARADCQPPARRASRAPGHAHGVSRPTPDRRMRERVEGTVWLEFVIEADGRLGDLRVVVTPHPDLAAAAIACARAWRFTPALKGGTPVAVVATMEMAFKLAD